MKELQQQKKASATLTGLFSLLILFSPVLLQAQQSGVSISTNGNDPHPSAILDVSADGKGILIPRISMLNFPVAPATGLLVYVVDIDPGFWFYNGTGWFKLMRAIDEKWKGSTDIYFTGGKAGIGTTSPTVSLDLESDAASEEGIDINNTGIGDPLVRFQVGGVTKYSAGIDNSDADKFKIGTTSVSTSTRMTISSAGDIGIGTVTPSATLHLNGTAKVLGPWETKVQGVDYLAATDGFVVAGLIVNIGSGDANAGLKGYTDNLTVPTTCRGLACVRRIGTGTQNGQDSFTMPVRKGNYWRVDYTWLQGDVGYSIEWIPFGTSNP